MKIPAYIAFLAAALLSALPLSHAHAEDVTFDVFYNSLADDGDWYNTPDYGYVWQPYVAYKTDKWRPYADGYWAQTDDGWTWVSYENFGWATYHYGRWTRLEGTGWVWVPGYDWGPGWVSWRTSDDYVGWAPLPPKRDVGGEATTVVDYNDVESDSGYNDSVDQQYDIGPDNYCFVQVRNFGAPVLAAVFVPPIQNIVIIQNTYNVTNITYRRGPDRVIVYNGGPDFGFISGHVERPIQRLRIERQVDVGYLREHGRGGGNPTLVRDGVLTVAAPMIAHRPMQLTEFKPARIKQTIAQPKVEHGWKNTGADAATVERARAQVKQQAQNPPPRQHTDAIANAPGAPENRKNDRPGNAGTPLPPAPDNTHRPLTDSEKTAKRDAAQRERDQRANGGAPAAPQAQPFATPAGPGKGGTDAEKEARRAQRQKDRGQTPGESNTKATPQAQAPAPSSGVPNGPTDAEREARHAQKQSERPPSVATPVQNAGGNQDVEREARRAEKQKDRASNPPSVATPAQADVPRERRPAPPQQQQQPPSAPQTANDPQRDARRAERQQQKAQPNAQPQPTKSDDQKKHDNQ